MTTVAAITMTSTSDKPGNIAKAVDLVRRAAALGAEWIQLPEMFAYHGPYDQVYTMAEDEDGPLAQLLSGLAKDLGIVLIAGSSGERPEHIDLSRNGHRRVYNTCYVYGRDGSLLSKYRKTHLFNLNAADGKPSYCESDGYIPGDAPVSFTLDGWKLAHSICYDLRFPAFYDRLAATGGDPDVILVPSAFTQGTGQAHWELLLRARAVERQAYIYAANQVGQHGPGKESFGHSMVIDPWGDVLANTGAHEGIALAQLSRDRLKEVRGRLPALANRRPSLYTPCL